MNEDRQINDNYIDPQSDYCLEVTVLHTDYDYDPECKEVTNEATLRFNLNDIDWYIENHCSEGTKIVGNIMNDGYAEDVDNGTRLYFDETEV